MSWLALDWAETASVADVYERVILVQMAARAKKDGTGVYLSPATMARRAVCSEQVVKDRLKAMRDRGVIAPGDQRLAEHIPKNRRPVVYDLMIPASFYSPSQLRDLNEERDERGLAPLALAQRPDLPEARPSRKVRSDAGTPNPAKTGRRGEPDTQPLTWEDSQGGLVDPPENRPAEPAGGSTTPPQGGLLDPSRGVYETPKSVRSKPSEVRGEGAAGQHAAPPGRPGSVNAPTPEIPPIDENDPGTWRCDRHRPLPLGADPGFCGPCGTVRRSMEARAIARRDAELVAPAPTVSAVDACRACNREGWVLERPGVPLTPWTRCDHATPVSEVVARVRAAEGAPPAPAETRTREECVTGWREMARGA